MITYLKLFRVKHYVKNFFIFLPLFFGLGFLDLGLFFKTFVAFASFSLAASGVYIFNDFFDIEEDKKHPQNKKRPLANEEISSKIVPFLIAGLWFLGVGISWFINVQVFLLLAGYVLLNILYSLKLKHIPILDVMVIAIGFVIRVLVGFAVTGFALSEWMLSVTFLLAVFLGFSKRRNDIILFLQDGIKTRRVIDDYNLEFLNFAIAISAATTIMSYMLYSVLNTDFRDGGSELLFTTSIFVIAGILRYVQLMFVEGGGKSPTETLWEDKFIQTTLVLWFISLGIILY